MATLNEETTFRPLSKDRSVSELSYDNFPVGVVICDTKGRIILMNQRNCEVFGIRDPKKVYGFSVFDDEDILPAHREQMKSRDDYSYSYEMNTDHLTARGKSTFSGKRQLFCRSRKIFDKNMMHKGYILVNVDLTETQLELRNETQSLSKQLQQILKSANMMSWRYDVSTGRILVNYSNAPADYLGETDTFIELTISDFVRRIHPDDQHIFLEQFARVMQCLAEELNLELRYRFTDLDHYLWAEMNGIVSEYDKNGKVRLIIGSTSIVEQRKRMEQDLVEAKEKAEASDKLKTAFIEQTNHEIRTPLNAIVGYADVLATCHSSLDDESRQELVRGIRVNSDKMLNMFNSILYLSQMSSGTLQCRKKQVSAHDICSPVYLKYRRLAAAGVELQFLNESDVTQVLNTDPKLLRVLLENLVDNAVKFTIQGSITISYVVSQDEIVFSVRDTGPGMTSEEHLFEIFAKGDKFTPGMGLGLPLCRALGNLLGGCLTYETQVGKGTVFHLALPLE